MLFTDADPMRNEVIMEYERRLFDNPNPNDPTEIRKTDPNDPRLYRTPVIEGIPRRVPLPLQFLLRPLPDHPKFKEQAMFGRDVVLYDNAGEDFLPSVEDVSSAATRHLAKCRILFFLFDPTQDPNIRERCRSDDPQLSHGLRADGSQPIVLHRQETLLREVAVRVRRYRAMSQTKRINNPLIIIVPKCDVWSEIANVSIEALPYEVCERRSVLVVDTERVESVSRTIEGVFRELCPELVATAQSLSTTVRYIPVSSLGRSPELVTLDQRNFYGIRPKDISPKWVAVPLLYCLCKWAPGLLESSASVENRGPTEKT